MNTHHKICYRITCLLLTAQFLFPVLAAPDIAPKEEELPSQAEYRQAMLSNAVDYAVEKGDIALMESLLKSGFDVNRPLMSTRTDVEGLHDGNFALHLAAQSGNAAMVRFLLAHKADPAIRNGYKELAVHDAEDAECIKLLEKKEPAKDEDAVVELLFKSHFSMGFLDFSSSPLLTKLKGKLPKEFDIRDISEMERKSLGGAAELYLDRKTGEEGGLISIELKPHSDGNGYDFKAGWNGGPLNGKGHQGHIIRWHGYWKVKVTKSYES